MTYSSIFGTLAGRDDVAQRVLQTLQAWLLTYLAEVERQEGLEPKTITPPGGEPPAGSAAIYPADASCFRSGLDFETWQGDELPLLIVVAQPQGDAERIEDGGYQQWYEVQVGAVCEDPGGLETAAQLLADRYGKAVTGVFAQQGGLGGVDRNRTTVPFAEKTVLVSAPHTEFVDGADRKYARSVTVAHVLVESIVEEGVGPRIVPADPYLTPSSWPTIVKVDVQLSAENAAGSVSPASGANVATPVTGGGTVLISE